MYLSILISLTAGAIRQDFTLKAVAMLDLAKNLRIALWQR